MKVGNIAGHADLSRPLTQEQIEQALKRSLACPTIRQIAKAGYGLEFLRPNAIARACKTTLPALPRFVRG
jgi:hypothetical protein